MRDLKLEDLKFPAKFRSNGIGIITFDTPYDYDYWGFGDRSIYKIEYFIHKHNKFYDTCGDYAIMSGLVSRVTTQEADDALPPVPDSVLYFNSETYGDRENDQRLLVGVGTDFTSSGNIFVGCKPRTDCDLANFRHTEHGIGINLDPDSALQLAHDLTRMALKLKREQEKD